MRVGCIQPNYIPWRGYFDFIRRVDTFVIHDDIQYTKQDWRNRNQIRTPAGLEWLTVPVKNGPHERLINEVEIDGDAWIGEHRKALTTHLGKAPFFDKAIKLWENEVGGRYLWSMNVRLIYAICDFLGITTRLVLSSDLGLRGAKTERLVRMMEKVGGMTYLSGPAAKNYLDEELMNERGFEVEWMTYDYPPYRQQYPGFVGTVTVLDAIANTGGI